MNISSVMASLCFSCGASVPDKEVVEKVFSKFSFNELSVVVDDKDFFGKKHVCRISTGKVKGVDGTILADSILFELEFVKNDIIKIIANHLLKVEFYLDVFVSGKNAQTPALYFENNTLIQLSQYEASLLVRVHYLSSVN